MNSYDYSNKGRKSIGRIAAVIIVMGLFIDNFGWFRSTQVSISATRVAGALLVIAGVAAVTLAKQGKAKTKDGSHAREWRRL